MITFEKEKDYLICVDSDGTVMDSMVIKHTKALAPKLIVSLVLRMIKIKF